MFGFLAENGERPGGSGKFFRIRSFAPAVALILQLGAPLFPAVAQEAETKLGAVLQTRMAAAGPNAEIRFSVVLKPSVSSAPRSAAERRESIRSRQQAVIDQLPPDKLKVSRRYENLAGFSGEANSASIKSIAQHPSVSSVYLDGTVHANLAQGVPLIGADQAASLSFTGSGIAVAVLDTGIDTNHPDLIDDLIEERCWCSGGPGPSNGCCPNGADTMTGSGSAEDDAGHGTEVSGIVTSGGVIAANGVAPDADIVAIKVLGGSGSGSFSDIAAGLDWLLTNHASLGVRVVNMSLGNGTEYSDPSAFPCTGTNEAQAIVDLVNANIAVVVASGNDGFDAGLAFPACVPEAISVGGVYDANVGSVSWCGDSTCSTTLCTDSVTAADEFVCHTNSSSDLDVLAPDWRTRTSQMGGGIANFGGTSAAAPYGAGLAALLFQQDPTRTPAEVLGLMTSGSPSVTNSDSGLSFPRADVSQAFSLCGNGSLDGGEDCDDGNQADGDCCSSVCAFEIVGSSCNDGSLCTESDACDGSGNCNQSTPVNCDNGLFCDGTETCDAVLGCQPGTPVVVDDGVGCTDDSCDEVADVVVNAANDGLCDNLLFCDGTETCDAALDCQPGTPVGVDDGIGCTDDSCDEVADVVVNAANDGLCDNLLFCDGTETCDAALDCQAGTPVGVDDGVLCTTDACDEIAGVVTNVPDASICDDSNPCTVEICDSVAGCSNVPIPGCAVEVAVMGPSAAFLMAFCLGMAGFGALMISGRRL